MPARSRITRLVLPVQFGAALLLAAMASGCIPAMYGYLGESPSASEEELQAAWDAKFPPGTARADLLAEVPFTWPEAAGAWPGIGSAWFVHDYGQGNVMITSAANQIACNLYVSVAVLFDEQDRIVRSIVRKDSICL
jgi:hypothetical protein